MLFKKVVAYLKRIPTLELTVHFLWSVLHDALCTEDLHAVIEALYAIATDPETNQETGAYNNPYTEVE